MRAPRGLEYRDTLCKRAEAGVTLAETFRCHHPHDGTIFSILRQQLNRGASILYREFASNIIHVAAGSERQKL